MGVAAKNLADWLRSTGQPIRCFLNCRANRAVLETMGIATQEDFRRSVRCSFSGCRGFDFGIVPQPFPPQVILILAAPFHHKGQAVDGHDTTVPGLVCGNGRSKR
jgi:hypothetical protein